MIGHHEMLIPLLHAAVAVEARRRECDDRAVHDGRRDARHERRCPPTSIELVQRLGRPRVLVVGDVMLDRYVWGDAERISQEAPVILLRADTPRGAARRGQQRRHHARSALGADVSLVGVVGTRRRRRPRPADPRPTSASTHEGVVADADRPTTVKERYIGRAQAPPPAADDPRRLRDPRAGDRRRSSGDCADVARGEARARPTSCWSATTTRASARPGCWPPRSPAAKARGVRVIADPIRGGDYSQVPRLLGHDAQPPRSRAWPPAARIDTTDEALAAAAELRDAARPRSRRSSRSTRTAWRWPTATAARPSSRPGRGRSTTSPAPATW